MPPKRGRGRPRGSGVGSNSGRRDSGVDQAMTDAPTAESSPFPLQGSETEMSTSATADLVAVAAPVDVEMDSPNLSPASAPTETPAPTPVRAPVARLESLNRPMNRGASSSGPLTRGGTAGGLKFKPKAVQRNKNEREQIKRQEAAKQAAKMREATIESRGRGSSAASRGPSGLRGRGGMPRGRGDVMGRRGLERAERATASGPFAASAPDSRERRPRFYESGSTFTALSTADQLSKAVSSRESVTSKSAGTLSGKQRATRADTTNQGIKQEPDVPGRPENTPDFGDGEEERKPDIKKEFPEPMYPEERRDVALGRRPVQKINIEEINLISDDEEDEEEEEEGEEDIAGPSRRKGKASASSANHGLKPIRLQRHEHKDRVTVVNTEPAAAPSVNLEGNLADEDGLFVPHDTEAELRHSRRLDYTRDGKRWGGAWQAENDLQVKPDPDSAPEPVESNRMEVDEEEEAVLMSELRQAKGKEREKPISQHRHRRPVLQTEEDKAEYNRHLEDIKVLAEELGGLQTSLPKDDDVKDTSHQGESHQVFDKEGRLYLFQFPPILPPLYNPVKKEEQQGDVEMTSIEPAPNGSGSTSAGKGSKAAKVDLTVPEVKEEEGAIVVPDRPGVFMVPPELISEEGFIGKLIVRESGKVELSWGGTSLVLGKGSEFDFLTTTVLVDGSSSLADDAQSGEVPGRGIGMGKVMGKFVVTPDWDAMI